MDKAAYIANVLAQAGTGGKGGRGVTKSRLLDDSDQNIGNAVIVLPQGLGPPDAANPGGTAQLKPELNPQRLLCLDALSPTGQLVTITMTAQPVTDPGVTPSDTVGPIVGIVEFGNGSVFTRVEVDVPVGPYDFLNTATNQAQQPRDGGVIVTVPSGTLRVYARNDGAFVTPTANLGVAGVLKSAGLKPPSSTPIPIRVQAFATYFTRTSVLTPRRTIYLGSGALSGANPNTPFIYSIPPFAKRVRVLRSPTGNVATFRAQFLDGVASANVLGIVDFPASTAIADQAFVEIPGTANAILLLTLAVGSTGQACLEFEIQI